MTQTNREAKASIIYAMYKATTGRNYKDHTDTLYGRLDPVTGTYYCGRDAQLQSNTYDELKRYIQSRYWDLVTFKAHEDGTAMKESEIESEKKAAEVLLFIMQKFNIPTCNFGE